MERDKTSANDVSRSFSIRRQDPDAAWKRIQQNTFTRWVNQHLKKVEKELTSLETGFSDGLKLISLIEVLSHKQLPGHNKKPKIRMQQLENVSIALEFLDKEGVNLVSIDSSHIVDCKLKLIKGMIWTLILHYSISIPMSRPSSMAVGTNKTPKQQLMDWVNEKLPNFPVNNFTADWKNGKAIGALVDATGPGLCPDWQDWDASKPVENATQAMDLAENWLEVPKLLTPEEMVNPHIDEQSMMTYLSQFPNAKLKSGAPLKQRIVKNIRDGEGDNVRAYGPGLEPHGVESNISSYFTIEIQKGSRDDLIVQILDSAGKHVDCKITPSLSDPKDPQDVYTCNYVPEKEGKLEIVIFLSKQPVASSPYHVMVEKQNKRYSILKVTANGSGLECEVEKSDESIQENAPVKNAETAKDSQCLENVFVGLNHLKLFPVNKFATFHMQVETNEDAELVVTVNGPSDDPDIDVTGDVDTGFLAEFLPDDVGPYTVAIEYNGTPVNGTPFTGYTYDASKVIVSKIPKVKIGKPVAFSVDSSNAGKGELNISVSAGGKDVPVQVSNVGPYKCDVTLVPREEEEHNIEVRFNKEPVSGSPFKADVACASFWQGISLSAEPESANEKDEFLPRDSLETHTKSITYNGLEEDAPSHLSRNGVDGNQDHPMDRSRSEMSDTSSSNGSRSSSTSSVSGKFNWFLNASSCELDDDDDDDVKLRKDNARAFYDACEKGEGWAKCKNYCSANAIFRSQGGLYHPPIASEPDLGGELENYVRWMEVIVNQVMPKCYLTDVISTYDTKTETAIFSAIFNGKHTKTPKGSNLPSPTKKSVKSDYVYRIHFNAEGKINSLVKIWNSEWAAKELGWMQ